jgi:hypothetical protein
MEQPSFQPKFEIFISCPHHLIYYPFDDRVKDASVKLEDNGFVVFCPFPITPRGLIQEIEYRRHFIIYADAILRIQDSEEVVDECSYAIRYGIPVFNDAEELIKFFRVPEESSDIMKRFAERAGKSKQRRHLEQLAMFEE